MLKQLRDLAIKAGDMSPQECRRLYIGLGETRRTLRRRLSRLKSYEEKYDTAKRQPLLEICVLSSRLPKDTQPWAGISGSDSGGNALMRVIDTEHA